MATGLLSLALLVPTLAWSAPAGAQPTGPATPAAEVGSRTLQARADVLRTRVEDLRLRQSVAVEAYDTAVEDVATAVSAEVRARTALDRATGRERSTTSDATRRVRSLYISGTAGQLSSRVGTVLAVGDLSTLQSLATGSRVARSARARDTAAVTQAVVATSDARSAEESLSAARATKTAAQTAAESAREQVTTSLAAQQQLLAGADAAVVAAVAAEEEQARQQALAAAAVRAAAVGVGDAVESPAPPGPATPGSVADAVAAASGTAQGAVAAARTRTGSPYVWGATGPSTFDCSGLTQWAYGQAGIAIPRTSRQQYAGLPKVALDRLQPGDLVFYASGSSPESIHHVALYLGGGRVLHAPHTGDVVREASVAMPGLFGAVRPAGS